MSRASLTPERRASLEDADAIARLLHDFNREFDEPTPAVERLARRIAHLLPGADTVVLVVGDGPDGLAVLRFREAIWSNGLECYLAELYVIPVDCGGADEERDRHALGVLEARGQIGDDLLAHPRILDHAETVRPAEALC